MSALGKTDSSLRGGGTKEVSDAESRTPALGRSNSPHSHGGGNHDSVALGDVVTPASSVDLDVLEHLPHEKDEGRMKAKGLAHAVVHEVHLVDGVVVEGPAREVRRVVLVIKIV